MTLIKLEILNSKGFEQKGKKKKYDRELGSTDNWLETSLGPGAQTMSSGLRLPFLSLGFCFSLIAATLRLAGKIAANRSMLTYFQVFSSPWKLIDSRDVSSEPESWTYPAFEAGSGRGSGHHNWQSQHTGQAKTITTNLYIKEKLCNLYKSTKR